MCQTVRDVDLVCVSLWTEHSLRNKKNKRETNVEQRRRCKAFFDRRKLRRKGAQMGRRAKFKVQCGSCTLRVLFYALFACSYQLKKTVTRNCLYVYSTAATEHCV